MAMHLENRFDELNGGGKESLTPADELHHERMANGHLSATLSSETSLCRFKETHKFSSSLSYDCSFLYTTRPPSFMIPGRTSLLFI
jgi:hypothetical protein